MRGFRSSNFVCLELSLRWKAMVWFVFSVDSCGGVRLWNDGSKRVRTHAFFFLWSIVVVNFFFEKLVFLWKTNRRIFLTLKRSSNETNPVFIQFYYIIAIFIRVHRAKRQRRSESYGVDGTADIVVQFLVAVSVDCTRIVWHYRWKAFK